MAYLCVGEWVGLHACVYYITVWEFHELYIGHHEYSV